MSMWAALYTIANEGTEFGHGSAMGTLDTGQNEFYIIVRWRQFR